MKSLEMAADYIYRANRCLREAEFALSESDYAGTVRRSQEALELSVKAVLRSMAVEYPREHDVGEALDIIKDRLPPSLSTNLTRLKELLTELSRIRGPAFYGYEREGIPASKAFNSEYAQRTYSEVKVLVLQCSDFISSLRPK
ncbi:HEPN domain-containing protein [Candidatus Bathyarchaeota archaeon]|nr:HEPN domain-containing protein [Candidatus Bathyarchaeota archaeon]